MNQWNVPKERFTSALKSVFFNIFQWKERIFERKEKFFKISKYLISIITFHIIYFLFIMNYSCIYLNFNYQANKVKNHTVPKNINTITLKLRMHYSLYIIAVMLRLGCHLFLWNHKEILYVCLQNMHVSVSFTLVKTRPFYQFSFSITLYPECSISVTL